MFCRQESIKNYLRPFFPFFLLLLSSGYLYSANYALQLNGTSQYASSATPTNSILNITGSNSTGLTIEMWIYRTNIDTGGQGLVVRTNGTTYTQGYGVYIYNNIARLEIYNGASPPSYAIDSSINVSSGIWHHIAFVAAPTTGYIFIDGVNRSGTVYGSPTMPASVTSGQTLYIGNDPSNEYYGGYIDEVRISSTVKYNATYPPAPPALILPDICTVGCWRFDEGSGSTAADSSGFGVNLVLTNSPTWLYRSELVTIQPDATAGIDTYLNNENTTVMDYNYGVATDNLTSRDHHPTLIKFDLSSIPSNATIQSAVMSFYTDDVGDEIWELYAWRIASGNSNWVEGTGNGSVVSGASCWNYRQYNTVNWAGSAGCNTAGTDYLTPEMGKESLIYGNVSGWMNIPLSTSQVQTWLTANYGAKVNFTYASGGGYWMGYFLSDTATASQRPKLTIGYTVPSVSPPNAVTNLSALNRWYGDPVHLTWTYPGPTTLPSGEKFAIQYSSWTGVTWSTGSANLFITTGTLTAGTSLWYRITGLTTSTTYYFRIWTSSGSASVWSAISNGATSYVYVGPPYGGGFNGTSSVGTAADSASLDINGRAITMEAWIYLTANDEWNTAGVVGRNIVDGIGWTRFQGLYGYNNGKEWKFGLVIGTTYYYAQSSVDLNKNEWVHIAGSFDGTNVRFFINGVCRATTTVPSQNPNGIAVNNNDWYVGRAAGSSERFTGIIDEVRISSYARYTADFTVPSDAFTSDTYTCALWHFEEGTGTTVDDSSDYSNTLTLTDVFWVKGKYGTTPVSPPNAVTNLSALNRWYGDPVHLTWTYPGPTTLPSSEKFAIQYSSWTGVTWSRDSAQVYITTGEVIPGETRSYAITVLVPEATYYFRIWTSSGSASVWSAISNGATSYVYVGPPYGLGFHGSSDSSANYSYAEASDNDSLDISTITVEAWVYPNGTRTGYERHIVSHHNHDNNNGWVLMIFEDGTARFRIYSGAVGGYSAYSNTVVSTNTWHHIAGTYDGSTVRVFLDGVEGTSVNISTKIANCSNPVRIGVDAYSGFASWAFWFHGIIDEVRISSSIRYTSNFTPATEPFSNDMYTRALWHLDDGSGTTSRDYSDYSNNLTITNAYWTKGYYSTPAPPRAITSLTASPGSNQGEINLSWIATGDDGIIGTAQSYTIRYSTIGSIIEDEFEDTYLHTLWISTNHATSGGSVIESSGIITVTGEGTDTWTANDEFFILYTSVTGDFDFYTMVSSQQPTNEWSGAGIMVRNSINTQANNGYAIMMVTPGGTGNPNRYHFVYDSDADGYLDNTTDTGSPLTNYPYPCYVRMKKTGQTITGYWSQNGVTWTQVASVNIPSVTKTQIVGLFVCSHVDNTLCEVKFNYFRNGWTTATDISGEPTPAASGTQQSMTVGSLTTGVTYYFNIRVTDDAGNISDGSNCAFSLPASQANPYPPTNLLCNSVPSPARGNRDFAPDLSWTFSDPNSSDTQAYYQVLVATSTTDLNNNIGIYWNTGKYSATISTAQYNGASLQYAATYYWKVRVWDNTDLVSDWSTIATFTMPSYDWALRFGPDTSTTDYVLIPDSDSLDPHDGMEGFTMEAFIKLDSLPAAYNHGDAVDTDNHEATIIGYVTSESHLYNLLIGDDGYIKVRLGFPPLTSPPDNRFWSYTINNIPWTLGKWYHIAASWQSSTKELRVYRDGQQIGTTQTTPDSVMITTGTQNRYIGGKRFDWDAGPAQFYGIIDEVRISSYPRYTSSSFSISTAPYRRDRYSMGLWYFNEGSGSTANDITVYKNNGTIYDAIWVNGYWGFDITPPATVTDLSAESGVTPGTIKLQWTSPGDDGTTGNITGGKYRIKYATYTTTDTNFWVMGNWTDFKYKYEIIVSSNFTSGQIQTKILTGLAYGVTYYIRIAIGDEVPNYSDLSNAVTVQASYSFVVVNTNNSGTGSLRQAILDSISSPESDYITFRIPTTDSGYNPTTKVWRISPTTNLPAIISSGTYIDATTQTDENVYGPSVEICGNAGATTGITITTNNVTLKGLIITSFSVAGISINGTTANYNTVIGCYIGLGSIGTFTVANGTGVYINNGSNNIIGGFNTTDRNIISGNNLYGIHITGANATLNKVMGNYIGTDYSGTVDLGNSGDGIIIDGGSSYNTIGSTSGFTTGEGRNIISGNNGNGIFIPEESAAENNIIIGNYIGTDWTGTADLGNTGNGVYIRTSNNTVGGLTNGERNVISGNDANGIYFYGIGNGVTTTNNKVLGNYIGTDKNGTTALGNSNNGIHIYQAVGNIVGSTTGWTTGEGRNIISGNNNHGIFITHSYSRDNKIFGNYIGVDVNGTAAIGNSWNGVALAEGYNNIVGSTTQGGRNIISGNNESGVRIGIWGWRSSSNTIVGNYIGTDKNGTTAIGNNEYGIFVDSGTNNIIENNTIAYSANDGIYILSNISIMNRISRNSIFSNQGLGIDLAPDGVTVNDPGDTDTGPNTLKNYPDITYCGLATISGTSAANDIIEIFVTSADPSGYGEGKTFIASTTANGSGNWSIGITFGYLVEGDSVTLTATDTTGNTSEFGPNTFAIDDIAPGAITNLSALPGTYVNEINLTWTAPGDNLYTGNITTGKYAIQRSTWSGVTWSTWSVPSDLVYITTSNVTVGSNQAYVLTGLRAGVTYYIRIWTSDEMGNWSTISNGATTYAKGGLSIRIVGATYYSFGEVPVGVNQSTSSLTPLTIENFGDVVATWQLRCTTSTLNGTPWTSGSTPGNNIFTLKALFNGLQPATTNFEDTYDVLYNYNTTCTSTSVNARYSIDGTYSGVSVPVGAQKNLWFKLHMPLTTSTTVQQGIRVYITAIQP